MTNPADRIHPRPQLARSDWTSLNGIWEFAIDDDDVGMREHWERDGAEFPHRITVPFPPESSASGIGEQSVQVMWYRLRIARALPTNGQRLILHFGAVDYRADVWVNGSHVAAHEGGSVGFAVDITDVLDPTAEQSIVVRVFDSISSLEQPRGKQDWEPEPHVIWYRRTSGIWREVWLEEVSSTHLDGLSWLPLDGAGRVRLTAAIAAHRPGDALEVELSLAGRTLSHTRHAVLNGVVETDLILSDERLHSEPERLQWSPDTPTLIDARLTLHRAGAVVDVVQSYLGLRTVGVDSTHFLLNDRPYYLRLVLEQAYWPETHLASPSDEALRREVELVKELGFNGVRMHQVIADPRFLYWCDRLGVLVWADAAASFAFTPRSYARSVREWIEVVERDVSHPSVVAWVPFNESWGVPKLGTDEQQREAVRGLTHVLRALDPTRLVLGNDGWQYVGGDIVGLHDYSHSADELRAKYGTRAALDRCVREGRVGGRLVAIDLDDAARVPVMLTEFGGVGYTHDADTWEGYGLVSSESDFLAIVGAQLAAVHDSAFAGFCYTQLTDTVQERNGLLMADRSPKAAIDVIAALVRDDRESAPRKQG